MKLINKKIIDACKADKKSHTSKLSKWLFW
jgi:hypothetical protein